jgi:hypothetical protein
MRMSTRRQAVASAPKKVRFGVYLDVETRKALLHAAIEEGRSATLVVEDLIKAYVTKAGKGQAGSK